MPSCAPRALLGVLRRLVGPVRRGRFGRGLFRTHDAPRARSDTRRLRSPIRHFHCRTAHGVTGTASTSPTAASRARFRASSRSVFNLVCFHGQAAPMVLATSAGSFSSSQRSWTQPA
jgi:hypothetical protein